jgi:hypothetical protein
MQERSDEFEAFVDGAGRRWRVARAFAGPLRRGLSGWVEADAPPEAATDVVALKRSSRRDVWALTADGAPPLVLKRYPPRSGLFGRARDLVATRAFAEFRSARRLLDEGLAVARPLAVVEPPYGRSDAPAWLASTRIVGALPLGTLLEQRFRPGDEAPAKFALARRALDLLRALHEAGFWHRDFHGGNLLLREAEGPAGVLHLIDLHAMWEIGSVPAALRARDVADFLHSLRYAFDDQSFHGNFKRSKETHGKLHTAWMEQRSEPDVVRSLVTAIREAPVDEACADVAGRLVKGQAAAGSVWDAVHLAGAELQMRVPKSRRRAPPQAPRYTRSSIANGSGSSPKAP